MEFIIPPTCATGPIRHWGISFFFFFILRLPSSVCDQVMLLPRRCAGPGLPGLGSCRVRQSGFEPKFWWDSPNVAGSPCPDRVDVVQWSLWNEIHDAGEFGALSHQTLAAALGQADGESLGNAGGQIKGSFTSSAIFVNVGRKNQLFSERSIRIVKAFKNLSFATVGEVTPPTKRRSQAGG